MDVPINRWTEEDVKFWTQTPQRYCPWQDVAAFFNKRLDNPGHLCYAPYTMKEYHDDENSNF